MSEGNSLRDLRTFLTAIVLVAIVGFGAYQAGAFHRYFVANVLKEGFARAEMSNSWLGITCAQFPADLMSYQQLIYATKPDVIIETGTNFGGLTLYLSTLLQVMNPAGKIYTIDIKRERWDQSAEQIRKEGYGALLDRIEFFHTSSIEPKFVDELAQRIGPDKKALVILDSRHTGDHVLEELKLYSRFIPVGGYIIVNDTIHDNSEFSENGPGPIAGVRAFVAQNPNFVIDRDQNRFMISCAPDGFLKRVR